MVLSSLDQKTAINLLFLGDFGGGKTATLIEGALQCALRGGTTYFICALNSGWDEDKNEAAGENVLDVALEMRFENTGVEVVTPRPQQFQVAVRRVSAQCIMPSIYQGNKNFQQDLKKKELDVVSKKIAFIFKVLEEHMSHLSCILAYI